MMFTTTPFVSLFLFFLCAKAGPVLDRQHPKLLVVSYDAFRYDKSLRIYDETKEQKYKFVQLARTNNNMMIFMVSLLSRLDTTTSRGT